MALITLREMTIGFRGPPLLDCVSCEIEPGQRIGLLGRNGTGKTTLLRLLSGTIEPDDGQVALARGARASLLPQDVPQDLVGTVAEVVSQAFSDDDGNKDGDQDSTTWQNEQMVERILTRMDLDGGSLFETLSSGMKRRVLLARALVAEPELLLLDEPTNHLDIDAVEWLEKFLLRWRGTLIFVTHDRAFLRRMADRIIEIDRGQLFDWSCDYDTFLERKQASLAAEEKQDSLFDKKLAQEEAWIRQGIKARRTRNEGRVRALEKMREVRHKRRATVQNVRMQIQAGQRSGSLVAAVNDVTFAYDDQVIVRDFSSVIMRGDKVGIIGPNGVGKTTLLRILLGQLPPQTGSVRLGTNLKIAYFDQLRQQLDEDATVEENVGDGYTTVQRDGRSRHIIGYLQDFLFPPERARTPVRFLSGGERNRVLLAKLFAKPANMIVLDEPTNDLDTETLELLEERLTEFTGTIFLVSHDREFLNNVVTSTIVFEESGVREYDGGYDDWLRQRPAPPNTAAAGNVSGAADGSESASPGPQASARRKRTPSDNGPRRRSYHEQREIQTLPETIERLEAAIAALHETMADADFFRQPGDRIAQEQQRLKSLEGELATAYERWETLESLAE